MKNNERAGQMDGQVKPDLDRILAELAIVLQRFGVEEFFMTQADDAQSHIIDNSVEPDHKLLTLFAMNVHALYQELAARNE